METNRRNFLIQSGAAVGVLGLGYLYRDAEPAYETPADSSAPPKEPPRSPLFKAALDRMKAENKSGIAVRIPEDPDQRHVPGHGLVWLLSESDPDRPGHPELLAEVVFVCLESSEIRAGVRTPVIRWCFLMIRPAPRPAWTFSSASEGISL